MINIYVGNLPYSVTDADLITLFSAYGQVNKATIVTDRESGRSKGFGFVELADHGAGEAAIAAMSGQPFNGRLLTVNEARPRGSGKGERVLGDGSGANAPAGDDHGREDSVVPREQAVDPAPRDEPAKADAPEVPASGGYSNRLLSR